MDILTKLRILLWAMVLCLWGTMVYQYLGDDTEPEAQMQWVANPFKSARPLPAALPEPRPPTGASPAAQASMTLSAGMSAPAEPVVALPAPWAQEVKQPPVADSMLWATAPRVWATAPPPSTHFIKPLPPRIIRPAPVARPRAESTQSWRRHEQGPVPESAPAVPRGFTLNQLRHFNVYSEGEPASPDFLDTLETLHGNLMLDLAAFSPWAREERVSIFLFHNQDSYRRVTGRPAWSGGASSISKRKIYLYESDELVGILAHELTHIYFDGFFLGGRTNPLWLSEGMATLVQVERGLSAPNWLPENLDILERGGGFTFEDLMRVEDTSGANDDNVRLWYSQSYSLVRFLIRSQWKSSFFHFCQFLREGRPVEESLYRAYGMPFNRLKALEHAWRYDVQTRKLSGLRTAELE